MLVPIVDHPDGLTVLLTQRGADLDTMRGRSASPADASSRAMPTRWPQRCARRKEEIGLERGFVEVVGYLPDHLIISGYRVTPVVGFVRPGFELELDTGGGHGGL